MTNILITGGTDFLRTPLVKRLNGLGYQLHAGSVYINSEPMQAKISIALGGWKGSYFPPDMKYLSAEMVKSEIIFNSSVESAKILMNS